MNFETPGYVDALGSKLETLANEYSASKYKHKHQTKMSPGSLAKECSAQIWYRWRNVKLKPIPGDLARRFADGNTGEPELIELLRGIGFVIQDREEPTHVLAYHADSDCYLVVTLGDFYLDGNLGVLDDVSDESFHIKRAKEKGVEYTPPGQIKVEDMNGHFVGFLDGIGYHPEHTFGIRILIECKTMNDKNYKEWLRKKIAVSHPEYYAQAIVYMKYHNLPYGLFAVKNKNTAEVSFELIRRNDKLADDYLRRAADIMTMKVCPQKIAQSAASHKCKFCDYIEICHYGEPVEINCRSCVHCVIAPEGKFYCERWQGMIPDKKAIAAACSSHTPVK